METNDVSIIRRLLDMDKKARLMVEKAEEEKQKAEASLAEEKARVESEIIARAQNRIARLKNQTTDETSKEARSIDEEGQQMMRRLEESFAKHHAQWEDELFARCISANRHAL